MHPISKAYKNILANNEFIYLDIGARGGPQKRLKQLCNDKIIKIILVELEETEAKKLEENYVVCDKPLWSTSTKKKNLFNQK